MNLAELTQEINRVQVAEAIPPGQAAADWLKANNITTIDVPLADLATRISIETGIAISQPTLSRVLNRPEFAAIQRETRNRKAQKPKRK